MQPHATLKGSTWAMGQTGRHKWLEHTKKASHNPSPPPGPPRVPMHQLTTPYSREGLSVFPPITCPIFLTHICDFHIDDYM
jgi:hypothetical protein